MRVERVAKFLSPVQTYIKKLAQKINSFSPERHNVLIVVVPAIVVEGPNGEFGFGAFSVRDGEPVIYIAGEPPDIDHSEWTDSMLPNTLAHEWAHYEQWRDGRKVQERGVVVRSRTILKALTEK